MASEFPIPKKEDAFPKEDMMEKGPEKEAEDMPSGEKLFKAIEADGKAGVFTTVETDENGEFVAKLSPDELQTYAEGVLMGDADTRNLQIGEGFDDIGAAEGKANELNGKFAPEADDDDEDLAECVVDAKAEVGGVADIMTELPEKMPEDLSELEPAGGKKGEKPPKFGKKEAEDEPMLGQFM